MGAFKTSAFETSVTAMDYETVSAEAFGASLRGQGLNILVRDVPAEAAFLTEVFGMTALVDFSHHFENALDLVRADKLAADADTMAVFLRANDIVIDLVDDARAGLHLSGIG